MSALGNRNFELMVDGQVVGRSGWFGSTTTSWTAALAALGVVPGDKLKISFDTKLLIASVELLDGGLGVDDSD